MLNETPCCASQGDAEWRAEILAKQLAEAQAEIAAIRANMQPMASSNAHYFKEMSRAQAAEQQLRRNNSVLKGLVKHLAEAIAL